MIALGNQFLQLRVLGFQGAQPFDVGGLQLAKALAPSVNGLLADLVLLRDFGDRATVGLPQDRNHLILSESTLLHGLPFSLREPFSQVTDGPEILGRSQPHARHKAATL